MYEDDEVEGPTNTEAPKYEYPQRVRSRLRHESAALAEQKARSERALEILERHPEFEELLELIELIGTPIKMPNTYKVDPLVTAD